ncbi:conserved hypothetical protein [Talaromyces stipitatus ATCC 10500]|uniref:Protein BIG1 n=1 Tax=Talaromyces stipitatus (strain ATCC 10500 / CBS 375.48 / QM 6759 / NRRL 1006) TaxID=441959 RepID=B8LZD7_TALSN|nr:uncharacterized protein TSTA_089260 [Talaromyces stipitatus ATCC 10500]EED21690.1 conserved hypothetical protein [Talaromyces stipitatus ATCC 10500]
MMNPRQLLLLALGAGIADALKDTSPFILLSTSDLLSSSSNIASATSLLSDVWSSLKTCPSDYYIIATQPGVHAADYSNSKGTPRLREKVLGNDKAIRSNITVTEVLGSLDPTSIRSGLEEECGAQVTRIDGGASGTSLEFEGGPRVIDISFPALSLHGSRLQELSRNDALLADVLDHIPSSKYTLIYVTSPREYEDEDSGSITYSANDDLQAQELLHQDLKRDFAESARKDDTSDDRSLFQKYQFLSPGIFMGFVVAFVLVTILYVGISALLGLEVPYAAFEKDTSPNSQKKQQ